MPSQFELGLMRADAALLPVAAFDRGKWSPAWEWVEPSAGAPLQQSVVASVWQRRNQPPPAIWKLWPKNGAPPFDVRVTATGFVDSHCSEELALRTDAPEGQWRANEAPIDALGLAVHGDVTVHSIEQVASESPRWVQTLDIVRATFDSHEVRHRRERNLPPIPQNRVQAPQLTHLFAVAGVDSALHFIAKREHRFATIAVSEKGCFDVAVMAGWVVPLGNGRYRQAAARMEVADCDHKGITTLEPVGAIAAESGRTIWFTRQYEWESETYVLFEAGPARVRRLLEVGAGGC